MLFGSKPWTSNVLAEHIESAGINRDQDVILHSSLKSVGKTESGPSTVIDALLSVIGPSGNLMVPTFTYSLPAWKGEPFNVKTSRARTGAIPEYVRHREDAIRSFHPTHSVAVIGPDSAAITEHHLQATPLGKESPFGRMLERRAKILMLGTRQDTNSSLHLCEVTAALPYVQICFSESANHETAWYHDDKQEIRFTRIYEVPGCSRGFRAIEMALINRGILKMVQIGNAQCQLLDLYDLEVAAREILAERPTLLLCTVPHCGICPKRRAYMKTLQQHHDLTRNG